jgi:putative membrane protein
MNAAQSSASNMATSGSAGGQSDAKGGDMDKTFVQKATIGGLFEVQSSQLAQQKGQSDQIKQFAQMMIADHGKANQELTAAAQQKHLEQPSALDEKHAADLKKLEGAQGADFDKEYAKAQLKAHKQAVGLFQKASQNCKDPDLKAWASKTLPTLQQHLEAAQKLPGNEGADKTDKPEKDKRG